VDPDEIQGSADWLTADPSMASRTLSWSFVSSPVPDDRA